MNPAEYKDLREKLGLTQAGLASRLGVSRKTVNSRETGAARITEEAALAVERLWDISMEELKNYLAGTHGK